MQNSSNLPGVMQPQPAPYRAPASLPLPQNPIQTLPPNGVTPGTPPTFTIIFHQRHGPSTIPTTYHIYTPPAPPTPPLQLREFLRCPQFLPRPILNTYTIPMALFQQPMIYPPFPGPGGPSPPL